MKICVIGDKDTVLGFALTGIKNLYPAEDREAAKNALAEVMSDPDFGVIIITERYAHSLDDEIRRWREENPLYPLIVEIQDKKGPLTREDPIRLLIKRAVGLDMKSDDVK